MVKFIGLIGAGYWGKNLVKDFNKFNALHTICDIDIDRLKEYSKKYPDIKITTDYDDLLKNQEITAICVSTISILHYKLCKQAIEANKHVYVEKPICLNILYAKELVTLSNNYNKILMVGHLLQYHSCINKIKEYLNNDKLGKLLYINSNRFNLGKFRKKENVLWSFAPHDLSVILSLVGELPDNVICTGKCHIEDNVHDITTMIMNFPNGIYAQINVNRLCPYKEQKLTIVGTKGMIVFDDVNHPKLIYNSNYVNWSGSTVNINNNKEIIEYDSTHSPLENECKHFIDCCINNKKPLTDGNEGLNVLKVLNKAQHSLDNNGIKVNINEDIDYYKHPTATINNKAIIGKNTKIWHNVHLMKCQVGKNCSFGQNVFVGNNVVLGNNVRVQNNVNIYDGVICEDNVFLGPSCTFTNDKNPRVEYSKNGNYLKTIIKTGASVGANATIICGIILGEYSFVGAGAVVTKDVAPYTLVVGNPAKPLYKVDKKGNKIIE